MKNVRYYLIIIFISFLVSLPLIIPFLQKGFFPTHDGEWAVVRLSEMYREVKALEIPARYSTYLNFQYGYPLFNFTYPMPYYLGLIFVFLKLGFVLSIKILFSLSVILSFFTMFLLSKNIWKNSVSAFVSAIFYIYAPYRIVDLYVRGSIGESLSFVLFPLILLWVKKIYEKKSVKDILILAFLYALLITMHNIMAVLFGLIIFLILILGIYKKQMLFVKNIITSLFLSICFSAFFWIPAIFEKNLIYLSKIPIADRNIYFVKLSDLFIPKWGYGVPTDVNGFGYQIGLVHIAALLVVFIFAVYEIKKKISKVVLSLILQIFIVSLLLFSFSSFIWSNIPLLSEINYPWTLLAIIMFLISLVIGYMPAINKKMMFISIVFAFFALLYVFPHAKPQSRVDRGDSFYTTNQATTTSSNELMPLWAKTQPVKGPDKKIENINGGEKIVITKENLNKIYFSTVLNSDRIVQINLIYFPGWVAYVNGVKSEIKYDNPKGLMQLSLNKGENKVKLLFEETNLRLISDFISFFSFIGILGYILIKKKTLKI